MEIKIDTKEKFRVLIPVAPLFSDKIAQEVRKIAENVGENDSKNLILNMIHVTQIGNEAKDILMDIYTVSVSENYSFVICCLQPQVKEWLLQQELFDALNITPTESEAWDMVQMEELEREMFDEE